MGKGFELSKLSILKDGLIYTKGNREALPVLFSGLCRNGVNRNRIIIYSHGNENLAKEIRSGCPDAGFFSLGNVESSITADSRHARNLGDQFASEIFANMMAIQNLDIIIIGADRIFISDRKGYSRRFTEEFWNSFLSSINSSRNNSRVFIQCGPGNDEVNQYLLSLCSFVLSADVIEDSIDVQIAKR